MICGLVEAFFAAGFVLLTTQVIVTKSRQLTKVQAFLATAKDRQLESDLKQKDGDIARANERAAKLEVEALQLRMQLLKQGARENLLTGEVRQKLVGALKPFEGQSVEVRFGLNAFQEHSMEPASPDVRGLAESLVGLSQDSKWQVPPIPFMSVLQGPSGMTVQISPKASDLTVRAALALIDALRAVPLQVQGPIRTEMTSNPRKGTVQVFLPQVPGGPGILTPMPEPTDETIILTVLAHPL